MKTATKAKRKAPRTTKAGRAIVAGLQEVLHAVETGDKAAVQALLQKGADLNAAQADGMTALLWSADRDDLAHTSGYNLKVSREDHCEDFGSWNLGHNTAEFRAQIERMRATEPKLPTIEDWFSSKAF